MRINLSLPLAMDSNALNNVAVIFVLIAQCLSQTVKTNETSIIIHHFLIGEDVSIKCNETSSRTLPPWLINGRIYLSTALPNGMTYDPRTATLTISNIQLHHHKLTIQCIHPLQSKPSNTTKLLAINSTAIINNTTSKTALPTSVTRLNTTNNYTVGLNTTEVILVIVDTIATLFIMIMFIYALLMIQRKMIQRKKMPQSGKIIFKCPEIPEESIHHKEMEDDM